MLAGDFLFEVSNWLHGIALNIKHKHERNNAERNHADAD
jgi:hypothetical protein